MTARIMAVSALVVLTVACSGGAGSPAGNASNPVAPSVAPVATAAPVAAVVSAHRLEIPIKMMDACDPETFNAVLGDGTCVRSGGVKFDDFIDQLTRLGAAGAWHFSQAGNNVHAGESFEALNTGGEAHTFTEVEEFGGGIVPILNQLSHTPVIAPECAALEPDDFVAPGATYRETVDHAGTLRFQCCIHPWMKLEVSSR